MATTSPQRLVVLLFERLVADLGRAKEAAGAANIEQTHNQLVHAQEIVYELRLALDVDAFVGGHELASLYDFLHAQMVEANRTKSPASIEACIAIATPLAETFSEAHRTVLGNDASSGGVA